ncbi:hypothetical protein CCR75_000365 [Bremia lactucae]|uniref:Uncharacterized protein n=1 Tax=Bremia lactucae TaxID=4779 RepID=A0A976IFZ6_BRELC|nr:hypothetical protein CCR75_000365 [Bremia lactucae]
MADELRPAIPRIDSDVLDVSISDMTKDQFDVASIRAEIEQCVAEIEEADRQILLHSSKLAKLEELLSRAKPPVG